MGGKVQPRFFFLYNIKLIKRKKMAGQDNKNRFTKDSVLMIIIFIVLFPGLFYTIPKMGVARFMPLENSITSYVVHALIFAIILRILTSNKIITNRGNIRDNMKTFILPCMITLAVFGILSNHGIGLACAKFQSMLLKVIFSVVILNLIEFYTYGSQ